MNLLLPRNTVILLMLLIIVVASFGGGASVGAAEASAGNPTPMANDSVPPIQETVVSEIRADVGGPGVVEAAAVDLARWTTSIAIVGMAVGHTSVGVLGGHLTQAWVGAIPIVVFVLTTVTTIQFVQKLREARR